MFSLPSHPLTCTGRMLKIHALLGVNFRKKRSNVREHYIGMSNSDNLVESPVRKFFEFARTHYISNEYGEH